MAITFNKQPVNYLFTLQGMNNAHLNDFAPLGGKHSQSQQANFDAQTLQGSLITPSDAIKNGELYQVNATVLAVKETFKLAENSVHQESLASDPIRAKMKAAKRDLNQIEDLVNGLKTKQNKPEFIEDARSHIGSLSGFIKNIHTGYQKTYGDIIKKATEYMQDINTAIGNISHRMNVGEGGKIKFYPESYAQDINEVVKKYSNKNHAGLDPNKFFKKWDLTSDADISAANPIIKIPNTYGSFEFWNKKLNGQGFIVKETKDYINIHPDYTAIKQIYLIISNSHASWSGGDIMAQEFQGIQTAIDSQKNAINSGVSRLLETFRQDNSHFDTLVQLLIQLIKDLQQYNNGLANS